MRVEDNYLLMTLVMKMKISLRKMRTLKTK